MALAMVLAGCHMFGGRGDRSAEAAGRGPIYSPNGEPLSGGPLGPSTCEDAMARWFDRVDANHDGAISWDEFVADARRQFAVMDLDKDGVIVPAELAQYRAPYLPGPTRAARQGETRSATDDTGKPQREGARGDRGEGSGGGGVAIDQPDPVMLADVNLRNHVSLADFIAYAASNFASLDTGPKGHLDKADLARLCAAREGH
jgi:hypothetical protein